MGIKIIDISEHNNITDYEKIKESTNGVLIRAGYGKGNIDSEFKNNIENLSKLNVPIGIYWFSYAYTVEMAINEAMMTVQTVRKYKIDLPIFFDYEYDSRRYSRSCGVEPTKELVTDMTKAFCKTIESYGYKAGYYANTEFLNDYIDRVQLKDYYFWYAWYVNVGTECDEECDIWQYSDVGKNPGISNNTDLNIVFTESIFNRGEDMDYTKFPRLILGSTGTAVAIAQLVIGNTYPNGIFDSVFETAVKAYQKAKGLTQDGRIGRYTWECIVKDIQLLKVGKITV